MASAHVAGTVVLMWSAAPARLGDIAQTRLILDQTAIDMSDLSCGGTSGNNNVWGEGRVGRTSLLLRGCLIALIRMLQLQERELLL